MAAYKELRESKNWEESLQIKGALDMLDNLFSFGDDVEDIIRQKLEEEQERATNGNASN